MNIHIGGLHRHHSVSHLALRGNNSDRSSKDDYNQLPVSQIKFKGVFISPKNSESQYGSTVVSHPLKYKESRKEDKDDPNMRTVERDTSSAQFKEATIRQLYQKLNARNQRIVEIQKQNKAMIVRQTSNLQLINKLEFENTKFKQMVNELVRNREETAKITEENRSKDEQIRREIFAEIQKLQKALQIKQKQILSLKRQPMLQEAYLQLKSREQQLQQITNRLEVDMMQQKYKFQLKIQSLSTLNRQLQADVRGYHKESSLFKVQLEKQKQKVFEIQKQNFVLQQEIKNKHYQLQHINQQKHEMQIKNNQLQRTIQFLKRQNQNRGEKLKDQQKFRERSKTQGQKYLFSQGREMKNENNNLKIVLQNAGPNLQTNGLSSDLQQLQTRIIKFQQRTNWLLSKDAQNQEIQIPQVKELKWKVKSLGKQNQALKSYVSSFIKKGSKPKNIQTQTNDLFLFSDQNKQPSIQNEINRQEYQRRISVYVSEIQRQNYLCEQYQGRIRQYQATLIKLKNRYEKQDDIYFKNKNLELQRRVNQLLKINTEMKQHQQVYTNKIQLLEDKLSDIQNMLDESRKDNSKLHDRINILNTDKEDVNSSSQFVKIQMRKKDEEIVKLSQLLGKSKQHIIELQNTLKNLRQIVQSYEMQNQKLILRNNELSQQVHGSVQSQMSQSFKCLQIEFDKLSEILDYLKIETLKLLDITSQLHEGDQIVKGVMERMRGVDSIIKSLKMIRTHMQSLQRHQRYSIVIR